MFGVFPRPAAPPLSAFNPGAWGIPIPSQAVTVCPHDGATYSYAVCPNGTVYAARQAPNSRIPEVKTFPYASASGHLAAMMAWQGAWN